MSENAYFFMDMRQPEDERTMSCMCERCHDEKHPDLGWFWEGELKGYGPYAIICDICGKIIHKPEKQDADSTSV
jgi:hypothetical protein